MLLIPQNTQQWLKGALAAIIAGAATAGGSWMAINAAGAAGAAIPILNWKALGMILLVSSLTNLFTYLQKSPIPQSVETTQVTVTKTTEGTGDGK